MKMPKSALFVGDLSQLKDLPPEEIDKEMLRFGIIAELDAVNLYEQMAMMSDCDCVKQAILHVAHEEKVHARMFAELLIQKDPSQVQEVSHGETIPVVRQELDKTVMTTYLDAAAPSDFGDPYYSPAHGRKPQDRKPTVKEKKKYINQKTVVDVADRIRQQARFLLLSQYSRGDRIEYKNLFDKVQTAVVKWVNAAADFLQIKNEETGQNESISADQIVQKLPAGKD